MLFADGDDRLMEQVVGVDGTSTNTQKNYSNYERTMERERTGNVLYILRVYGIRTTAEAKRGRDYTATHAARISRMGGAIDFLFVICVVLEDNWTTRRVPSKPSWWHSCLCDWCH